MMENKIINFQDLEFNQFNVSQLKQFHEEILEGHHDEDEEQDEEQSTTQIFLINLENMLHLRRELIGSFKYCRNNELHWMTYQDEKYLGLIQKIFVDFYKEYDTSDYMIEYDECDLNQSWYIEQQKQLYTIHDSINEWFQYYCNHCNKDFESRQNIFCEDCQCCKSCHRRHSIEFCENTALFEEQDEIEFRERDASENYPYFRETELKRLMLLKTEFSNAHHNLFEELSGGYEELFFVYEINRHNSVYNSYKKFIDFIYRFFEMNINSDINISYNGHLYNERYISCHVAQFLFYEHCDVTFLNDASYLDFLEWYNEIIRDEIIGDEYADESDIEDDAYNPTYGFVKGEMQNAKEEEPINDGDLECVICLEMKKDYGFKCHQCNNICCIICDTGLKNSGDSRCPICRFERKEEKEESDEE